MKGMLVSAADTTIGHADLNFAFNGGYGGDGFYGKV
jgi:hypothetical protein